MLLLTASLVAADGEIEQTELPYGQLSVAVGASIPSAATFVPTKTIKSMTRALLS